MLVGRSSLLARLRALESQRLVTLTGPPGSGKTALAEVVIAEAAPRFAGVLRRDPEALANAPTEAATERPTLVLVDGFERGGDPRAIARWLAAAPQLHLRVTARAALGLSDEVVVPVGPLDEADAVALLIAQVGRHGGSEVAGLDDIARAVDRAPLALLRIARAVATLGAAHVRARLAAGPEALLALLEHGPRDGDPRHASLRGALDEAWAELDAPARRVLAACALSACGVEPAVLGGLLDADATDALDALLGRGVLVREGDRVRALEPFAAHARVRGHDPALAARHALLHVEATELDAGALRAIARAGLAGELPVDLAARAVLRLLRGRAETDALDALITPRGLSAVRVAELLGARGELRAEKGAFAEARRDLEGARARLAANEVHEDGVHEDGVHEDGVHEDGVHEDGVHEDGVHEDGVHAAPSPSPLALAARIEDALCVTCRRLRDLDAARAHGERARVLHAQRTDPGAAADETRTLGALAAIDVEEGRLEDGRRAFEALRRRAHRLDDRWSAALAQAFIGHIDHEQGRLGPARRAFTLARETFAAIGDRRLAAVFEGYAATIAHERGEVAEAAARYDAAIAALGALGARAFEGLFWAARGALDAEHGRLDEAAHAFDAAERHIDASGDPALGWVVRVHRLHLELSDALHARAVDRASAVARIEAARDRVETEAGALARHSDDVRFALRILASRLATVVQPGPTLVVGAEGFAPSWGPSVSLAQRHPMRRILGALVDARLATPGAALPLDALVHAGWGDERMLARSAAQRVRVAIAELRGMGLREVLLSRGGGYLLDPAVRLLRARAIDAGR